MSDDKTEKKGLDPRWIGGGILAAAAGLAGAWYLREKLAEKPHHRPLLTEGDVQLRAYPRLLLAETLATGPRERALEDGYKALSRYLGGRGRPGRRIRMTAPVLSDKVGDAWRTRFVMPDHYRRDTLPEPAATPDVRIVMEPARRIVAIGFAGRPDDGKLAGKEAELRRWIASKGLRVDGEPVHAFYNSPFIPSAIRRTEVLIPVG